MKKPLIYLIALAMVLVFQPAFASTEVEMLKQQLEEMSRTMEMMKTKLETLEKADKKDKEEVEYLGKRLDKAELHTATDKVSLGLELRSKADSIHYNGMLSAPSAMVGSFFTPATAGGFKRCHSQSDPAGHAGHGHGGYGPPPGRK